MSEPLRSSTDPLEYQATQLVAALRRVAGDARRPLQSDEDPAAILAALARRLEAAADGLAVTLEVIAQARMREPVPVSRRN